jgi:hypothetical protein
MVFHTGNENHPHIRLSVPKLQALAATMTTPPTEEVRYHIVTVARRMIEEADDGKVSPGWLLYEVHQTYDDVTIDQVAWVLMVWLQIPRR